MNNMAYVFQTGSSLSFDTLDKHGAFTGAGQLKHKAPLPEEFWGSASDLSGFLLYGVQPPAELLNDIPNTLRVYRRGNAGYCAAFDCWLVDQRARALIQQFTPQAWWFYEIANTVDENNSRLDAIYYLFSVNRISTYLQIIDIGNSEVKWIKATSPSERDTLLAADSSNPVIFLRKKLLPNLHIWQGAGAHLRHWYFCSDAFYEKWNASGMNGLRFVYCNEVND
jgi:hypothetical protein